MPIWNVYSEKTGDVWYGDPGIAAKVLRDRQVDYIVINLSKAFWLHAYAPLFRPQQIGKYFKVEASFDSLAYGKSYLLTWRAESPSDGPLMEGFLKDYSSKVEVDMKTGRGIHDYVNTYKAGKKRFGNQWTWNTSWETR